MQSVNWEIVAMWFLVGLVGGMFGWLVGVVCDNVTIGVVVAAAYALVWVAAGDSVGDFGD